MVAVKPLLNLAHIRVKVNRRFMEALNMEFHTMELRKQHRERRNKLLRIEKKIENYSKISDHSQDTSEYTEFGYYSSFVLYYKKQKNKPIV